MKKIIYTFFLVTMIAGCSSSKPTAADKKASSYEPVVSQDAQIARLETQIQNDPKLDQEKKDELVKLVHEQGLKVTEFRKRQSQLRSLLVDQLLAASNGTNQGVLDTTKALEKLNEENLSGLNDFILKFKNISGESAARMHMREMTVPAMW